MADWDTELSAFLQPFLDKLGHKKRRQMCPLYVSGLIGPGDRKSIEPMAERFAPGQYDRLHHFISDGLWDAAPLETELARQADRIVGASSAFLVIDDTGLPKKGDHSVGVAPQYASMLGKRANCQTLVSVTLARDEVPVPVGLRLFLPESWTSDTERMAKAGVPDAMRTSRTKPEIALAEIDRLIAAGIRFGTVLADAGYGLSAAFRQGLSGRGLTWAVGIPKHQKVYPHKVELIFPVSGHGRPRKHPIPDILSVAAETILTQASWKKVSWRRGKVGDCRLPLDDERRQRGVAALGCKASYLTGMQNAGVPGDDAIAVGMDRFTSLIGNRRRTQNLKPGNQALEVFQFRPLRRFRNPAEMAPIAGPIDEKLIKRLDGRLLHAPDQAAISLSSRCRPARHRQTYQQFRHRNEQLPLLQGFDHGLGDRLALFGSGCLACRRGDQGSIIARPDGPEIQCDDNLPRMFSTGFLPLGIEGLCGHFYINTR